MFHPSFHLSLAVLVHYRSQVVFSLGGWFPQIPSEYLHRSTRDISRANFDFVYKTFTFFGHPFQNVPLSKLIPHWDPTTPVQIFLRKFARVWALPLSLSATNGIIIIFSSSPYLDVSVQVVSSTAAIFWPKSKTLLRSHQVWPWWGFPIRTPPGYRLLASNRRLSRPTTSFFGNLCQGIHCLR